MLCSVFSLTLGILSSLLYQDVSGVRLPLIDDSESNRIPTAIFSENNQDVPRSLEMEELSFNVVPTSGRASSPTILRLHPISAKPSHLHANLPLRFGREVFIQRTPKSAINLPQRFGRSQDPDPSSGQLCTECRRAESPPSATLPQRFGRRNIFIGDPFRALALFTRTLESPVPRGRTEDYDYMLGTIQEEDKALKSRKFTDVE
ncbi:pro-FMRFamide-related neuropeptide VF [Astyanax mexicanus]|uniref:Uncharacterized protein n=1 Tax=Astyanax mexicanus TaxID=7994 RepID=A0A8T2M7J5_ASTMX|nr:pro-FMRFamide-related neuropeptide VF [Astyanax mexicanus]KAG9280049.1 hypothetical protein AMEX_G5637 [Astyanax mexicanus]